MFDRLQLSEHYSRLADDELARIALSNHLMPEAQKALTAELEKRGMTDLSKYKKALAESLAASSPENELRIQAQMKQEFAVGMLVFMACCFATALPFMIAGIRSTNDSDRIEISIVATMFVAISCYFGHRARRQGSHKGYVLKLVVPLVLLGISTLAALIGIFLNVRI